MVVCITVTRESPWNAWVRVGLGSIAVTCSVGLRARIARTSAPSPAEGSRTRAPAGSSAIRVWYSMIPAASSGGMARISRKI